MIVVAVVPDRTIVVPVSTCRLLLLPVVVPKWVGNSWRLLLFSVGVRWGTRASLSFFVLFSCRGRVDLKRRPVYYERGRSLCCTHKAGLASFGGLGYIERACIQTARGRVYEAHAVHINACNGCCRCGKGNDGSPSCRTPFI